jgi:hypothetical protein
MGRVPQLAYSVRPAASMAIGVPHRARSAVPGSPGFSSA